jgi:peptide/nickel transport system ATP-binding protein
LYAPLIFSPPVAPLLEVNSLHIGFAIRTGETTAVRDISFAIAPRETLALVGESGSGKSVTALALLRLLPQNARMTGDIRFDGRSVLALPDAEIRRLRGRGIAMVFQEPMTALNPVLTVGEQVAEAVRVHHPELSRREIRERTLEALDAVALPRAAQRYGDYPHQFSGGQRQRIVIAMAIVNRPQLLIADEPTTALDVTVQAQVLDLLASLRERFGLAMLFISHDLAVVARVADRIAILRHGALLESGPRDQIFLHPQQLYTKNLLAAVPTLHTRRDLPLAMLER